MGEFVLQVPFYPPIETIEDYRSDTQRCLQIIQDAISPDKTRFKISDLDLVQVNSWRMEAIVADQFHEKAQNKFKTSRVFLAGDSAHAFPPSGGFGLNTGIGDAYNLAHKIAKGI